MSIEIGIIGGSGLYDMAELTGREERWIDTPFGEPSGPYVIGTLRGKRVAFLARHGVGHRILPSELNFRSRPRRTVDRHAVWRAVRSLRDRDPARQARRLPGAPRRRPPHPTVRAELPISAAKNGGSTRRLASRPVPT